MRTLHLLLPGFQGSIINMRFPLIHSGESLSKRYLLLTAAVLPAAVIKVADSRSIIFSVLVIVSFIVSGIFNGSLLAGFRVKETCIKYLLNALLFVLLYGAEKTTLSLLVLSFMAASFLEEVILRRPPWNPFPPFITAVLFSGGVFAAIGGDVILALIPGFVLLCYLRLIPLPVCLLAVISGLVYYYPSYGVASLGPGLYAAILLGYPGLLPAEKLKNLSLALAAGYVTARFGGQGFAVLLVFSRVLFWL